MEPKLFVHPDLLSDEIIERCHHDVDAPEWDIITGFAVQVAHTHADNHPSNLFNSPVVSQVELTNSILRSLKLLISCEPCPSAADVYLETERIVDRWGGGKS